MFFSILEIVGEREKMHNDCFAGGSRLNWFCMYYEVEIPLFQKPPQCTIKINPAILQEKLKRKSIYQKGKFV